MKSMLKALGLLVLLLVIFGAVGIWYLMSTGLSAREEPGALEAVAARRARTLAIARHARSLQNPVAYSDDVVASGRAHFADHCASCHANDGSGETEIGRGLYPRAPDMRASATQELSDGELFWIIENGIRFTGMPAWSTGTKEGQEASWHLVHFIRRLPKLTKAEIEEMEALNPRSPAELEDEKAIEEFLRGGDKSRSSPAQPKHRHPGDSDE
ncbi:MAG TPA: c-type cytochrome [Vicinamibacterales bacterium]|jgi:mono/diheme cytochrome c family protein|nr:c-type cytochrome [Vicinamibacterales bacterium]